MTAKTDLERALAAVRAARASVDACRGQLERAIADAVLAGGSMRTVGEAAGMTGSRVHQIVSRRPS